MIYQNTNHHQSSTIFIINHVVTSIPGKHDNIIHFAWHRINNPRISNTLSHIILVYQIVTIISISNCNMSHKNVDHYKFTIHIVTIKNMWLYNGILTLMCLAVFTYLLRVVIDCLLNIYAGHVWYWSATWRKIRAPLQSKQINVC